MDSLNKIIVLITLATGCCLIGECSDNVDVPLTNELQAPLKATLDISLLNKEIESLIKKKVKEAVRHAVHHVVTGIAESKLQEKVGILESKFSEKVSELTETSVEKEAFNKKIDDMKNTVQAVQDRVDKTMETEKEAFNKKIDDMKNTVQGVQDQVDKNMETEKDAFNQKIEEIKSTVNGVQTTFSKKIEKMTNTVQTVQQQVDKNKERVALSACTDTFNRVYTSAPVKFPSIRTHTGISDTASFLSTGKFTVQKPGLYYVSAHIRSNTENHTYYIKKNKDVITRSAITSWSQGGGEDTSSMSAVVQVSEGDTLYIQTGGSIYVNAYYSCLTIIKVK